MSHDDAPPLSLRLRHWLVLIVMGTAMSSLVWRVVDLQVNHRKFLETQGDARHLRVVTVPAHRGMILDRHGEPLAVSTPVESVWANPQELATQREHWPELAKMLNLDPVQLENTIAQRGGREFVYLKRHIDPALAERVLALHIDGVYTQREYRRYYPDGEVTAHVLGFTNIDDRGQEGLELAYDNWLRGEDGSKQVIRDRLGHIVEDVQSIRRPHPGHNLTLSIDRRIQFVAYRALLAGVQKNEARAGSAVVLDVHTGEVLAMVNQPSYNPNKRVERVTGRYRNRAVTDVFEPGSTIKPLTISDALMSGLYTPDTLIKTGPGYIKIGRYTIRDVHDYGTIDVAQVIQKSSNVGASKIALSLPPQTLWKTFDAFGIGHATGSGFPGESSGIFTNWSTWREAHRVTVSFGYGVSVTALQLARAYAAIANDGVLVPVTFLKTDHPAWTHRVEPARIAQEITRMLEMVVGPGGTGGRAEVPGYHIAGKTGTVRKAVDGGYTEQHYLAVFAGFAPATAPRLACVVVVDDPQAGTYYGGTVAAPVFAHIMSAALRLTGAPPDDIESLKAQVAMGPKPATAPYKPAEAVQ